MKTNKEKTAMLKKCITILTFAAAAVMPAAPVAAWEQVCMKLPLWKTWFAASFHVVYDFRHDLGILPYAVNARPYQPKTLKPLPASLKIEGQLEAQGVVNSPNILVNQTKCASIGEIDNGTAFFVYVQPKGGRAVICKTHSSNPDQWYIQTTRPYRTLNYESWGAAGFANCKFTHES